MHSMFCLPELAPAKTQSEQTCMFKWCMHGAVSQFAHLKFKDSGSNNSVRNRRAVRYNSGFVVAPRRRTRQQLFRLGVFSGRDVVLKNHTEDKSETLEKQSMFVGS